MSGADISARPIATICRSPPLMVLTTGCRRSCSRGNSASTRARFSPRRRARAAQRRRARGSPAPSGRRRCRGLPAPARRRLRRSGGLEHSEIAPVERMRAPGCGRTSPAIALSRVVLPAPLAPRMATISPRRDAERDVRRAPGACRRATERPAILKHRHLPDRRGRPRGSASTRPAGPRRSCGRHS